MRRWPRLDANHGKVVDAFKGYGCSVFSLASVGKGCPDLVVGYKGWNLLVEIKDGSKCKSKQALKPDEERFRLGWRGQYAVVSSDGDVWDLVKRIRLQEENSCPF